MNSHFRILIKGLTLVLIFSLILPFLPGFGNLSAYNWIFPGRERLPFGENPAKTYNLSLYNLDAMFASLEINQPKSMDEFRVVLIGDSSVWGTLLKPEETLAGQLNQQDVVFCGKDAQFYNLGYPTISLTKDLLLLENSKEYDPDLVIWLTTLEAFPLDKQLTSPLVANNAAAVKNLIAQYDLPLDPNDSALVQSDFWDQSLFGQRRSLADLIRLQLYGVMWAATGIDQVYSENYSPPKIDFEENDTDFYDLTSPLDENQLAYDVLSKGIESSNVPVLLVNEPMLVSEGQNSDVRYNFFYPRWTYDAYRDQLSQLAVQNGWNYLDVWDIVPNSEYTNSAIHLTPQGTSILASQVLDVMPVSCGDQ